MSNKFKLDSRVPKKICIICLIKNPLKVMKNAFYFILKALFVLKIFKFSSRRKNGLIRKIGLTSKFMRHNLVYKPLQYTYCEIFHKVKATRQ